jgi:hypothetical protein
MNIDQLRAKEALVAKRSKEDFDKEWAWLFDGLPMKHRARLESKDGVSWLKVSFVGARGRAWSTEKYLLRDLVMHPDDYRKAVEAQCVHSMHLVAESGAGR